MLFILMNVILQLRLLCIDAIRRNTTALSIQPGYLLGNDGLLHLTYPTYHQGLFF